MTGLDGFDDAANDGSPENPASENGQSTLTAQDVRQFHQNTRAVLRGGIDIDLGQGPHRSFWSVIPDRRPTAELILLDGERRILATMAGGGDVFAWLSQTDELPPPYRQALLDHASHHDMSRTLDRCRPPSTLDDEDRRSRHAARAYLTTLACVAFGGLWILRWFTAPQIDAMRAELAVSSDIGPETELTRWTVLGCNILLLSLPVMFLTVGFVAKRYPVATVTPLLGVLLVGGVGCMAYAAMLFWPLASVMIQIAAQAGVSS